MPQSNSAQFQPRRRTPKQKRSLALVEAIVEATWSLLEQQDFATLTTNHIAQRAGVSIGSLYQYFPNKEAILLEAHRRHLKNSRATMERAFEEAASMDCAQSLRHVAGCAISLHVSNATAFRVFDQALPLSANADSKTALFSLIDDGLRQLLIQHSAHVTVHDVDASAFVLRNMVRSAMRQAIRERRDAAQIAKISDELNHAIASYLKV